MDKLSILWIPIYKNIYLGQKRYGYQKVVIFIHMTSHNFLICILFILFVIVNLFHLRFLLSIPVTYMKIPCRNLLDQYNIFVYDARNLVFKIVLYTYSIIKTNLIRCLLINFTDRMYSFQFVLILIGRVLILCFSDYCWKLCANIFMYMLPIKVFKCYAKVRRVYY